MSAYAKRMARLSAKIFGEVYSSQSNKSMKVVKIFSEKPKHLNEFVVDYYPPYENLDDLFLTLRSMGLYR